jgi:hypothetical protein
MIQGSMLIKTLPETEVCDLSYRTTIANGRSVHPASAALNTLGGTRLRQPIQRMTANRTSLERTR